MNCKICKTYNTNTVEVFNTITKRLHWLCFECWASSSKYWKLSSLKIGKVKKYWKLPSLILKNRKG
jgi:hypothetical protein